MALRWIAVAAVAALITVSPGCVFLRGGGSGQAHSDPRTESERLTRLAQLYERHGHHNGALRLYEQALQVNPRNATARERVVAMSPPTSPPEAAATSSIAAAPSAQSPEGPDADPAASDPVRPEKPSIIPVTGERPAPLLIPVPEPKDREPEDKRPAALEPLEIPQIEPVNVTTSDADPPGIEIRPYNPQAEVRPADDEPEWARTAPDRQFPIPSADLEAITALVGSDSAAVRKSALVKLAEFGAEAKPAQSVIRSMLDDPDVLVRVHAAWALCCVVDCTSEDVGLLSAFLRSEDDSAAQLAAYCLGRLGPGAIEAAPELESVCDSADASWGLRIFAAEALLAIRPDNPAPVARLIESLRSSTAGERWLAAFALSGTAVDFQPAATLALIEALGDPDAEVCSAAALALGAIGPAARDAIPHLEAALLHPSADVREAASAALACIGE